jgi:hypothetical protein
MRCRREITTFATERSPSLVRSNRLTLPSPISRASPLATHRTRSHPPSPSRPVILFEPTSPTARPSRPRFAAIQRSPRPIKTPNSHQRSTTLPLSVRVSSSHRRRTRSKLSPISFVCSYSSVVRCHLFRLRTRSLELTLAPLVFCRDGLCCHRFTRSVRIWAATPRGRYAAAFFQLQATPD